MRGVMQCSSSYDFCWEAEVLLTPSSCFSPDDDAARVRLSHCADNLPHQPGGLCKVTAAISFAIRRDMMQMHCCVCC
jgi:hypothetical protein